MNSKKYYNYLFINILLLLSLFVLSCDDNKINDIDDNGPKPAIQSDFIGTWETDYITAEININSFGFINRARLPNIIFEMNINNWEEVQCEVTFEKFDERTKKWVPDEEFSRSWREGKTTYKITGTVTKNNSPYNDLANIGFSQNIYLHHSGYKTIFIGLSPTDANSGYYFRK